MSLPAPGPENVELRNRLAELLVQAAQVEHDILCQYLFAAVTLKQRVAEGGVTYAQLEQMRRWKGTITEVARQEMEHLGIVTNLLTAIGEAPRFDRPEFPVPTSILPIEQESRLVPFSEQAILRFVCFEMPASPPAEAAAYLRTRIPEFDPASYDAIYTLYEEIKSLFERILPADLFIGPPADQFLSGGDFDGVAARGLSLPGDTTTPTQLYDISIPIVIDAKSALAAVDQIIEEGEGGEGGGDHTPTSHFARFLAIHQDLASMTAADPAFEPARAVVHDPRTSPAPGATTITNPATIQVSELFDLAYAAMMQLLIRLFNNTDESKRELAALESIALFPVMTTVIRPLAEVLTLLPAFDAGRPERAGPTFTLPRRLDLLPHREAAWRNIGLQLGLLEQRAATVAQDDRNPEAVRPRLGLVSEQVARIRYSFESAMPVARS